MPLPRVRFTLRWVMLAIVVVALCFWWGTRPYPGLVLYNGGWLVRWSDGSATMDGLVPRDRFRAGRWFSVVRWSDGQVSLYLKLRDPKFLP